jgi:hypothetical protein
LSIHPFNSQKELGIFHVRFQNIGADFESGSKIVVRKNREDDALDSDTEVSIPWEFDRSLMRECSALPQFPESYWTPGNLPNQSNRRRGHRVGCSKSKIMFFSP